MESCGPKANKLELLVDTGQLIGAIKRTSVFSNKASCLIVLRIIRDKLTVFAQDIDFSTSAEETLEITTMNTTMNISIPITTTPAFRRSGRLSTPLTSRKR